MHNTPQTSNSKVALLSGAALNSGVAQGQAPSADLPGRCLNTAQASTYLGIPLKTLETWRVRGGGPPYVKAGGRLVLYRIADLDEWVAARIRHSTSEAA